MATLLLIGAAGCGSRTSTLDQGAYLDDGLVPVAGQSSGGASGQGGSPSRGGAQSSPTAGSASMPIAGEANAPSDTVAQACQSYCSGYTARCPSQLMGQNCEQVCQQEMTGFGERCQGLGLKALKCLTPFFKSDAPSCEAAIASSLTECGARVQRFQNCKGVAQPKPEPEPEPPPPPSMPGSCPSVAETGPSSCRTTYSCANGAYTVSCDYAAPGAGGASPNGALFNCICAGPTGGQAIAVAAPTAPCATAAQLCGFTSGPILE